MKIQDAYMDYSERKGNMLKGKVKVYRRPALRFLSLGIRHHHQDLRKRRKKTKQNTSLDGLQYTFSLLFFSPIQKPSRF